MTKRFRCKKCGISIPHRQLSRKTGISLGRRKKIGGKSFRFGKGFAVLVAFALNVVLACPVAWSHAPAGGLPGTATSEISEAFANDEQQALSADGAARRKNLLLLKPMEEKERLKAEAAYRAAKADFRAAPALKPVLRLYEEVIRLQEARSTTEADRLYSRTAEKARELVKSYPLELRQPPS